MDADDENDPDRPLAPWERTRLQIIAAVEREIEELESASEASVAALQTRNARRRGVSTVYSIRLDRGEVEAIECRAAAHGLKPTVFARNLIRMGIMQGGSGDVAVALELVASAVEELRSVLGALPMRAGFD